MGLEMTTFGQIGELKLDEEQISAYLEKFNYSIVSCGSKDLHSVEKFVGSN